jgi:hypothetical protein
MKQRLLVMNGQKILQHEQEGRWQNDKVEKAGPREARHLQPVSSQPGRQDQDP